MKILILATVIVIINIFILYASQIQTYEELRKQIQNLQPDENKIANVDGLFLEKEGGFISIETGKLYFYKPINNRVCVAVFIGVGSFAFTPPILSEKLQLERFYGSQYFERPIKSMVLYFTDSTYNFIKNNFVIQSGIVDPKVEEVYKISLKYNITGQNDEIDSKLTKAFLEQGNSDLFYSHLLLENNNNIINSFFWVVDPLAKEEVQLLKGNWFAGYGSYTTVINQFDYSKDFSNPESINSLKDQIQIEKYTIKCKIDDNLFMSCITKVDFTSLSDNVRWIEFSLHEELDVDSIVDEQGNDLYFFKPEKSGTLWVKFNDDLREKARYSINMSYKGKYLDWYSSDWVVLKASSLWYPRYGEREKAHFDLEYTTPKRYKFCSVGEEKSRVEEGDFIKTHWVTRRKSRNTSFNLGDFMEKTIPADSVTPEIVFYFRNPEQVEAVMEDIKLSIEFYNKIYDNYITDKFFVTEIPAFYGEAFPGMLHLSLSAFLSQEKKGHNENFVSHEISHQWWGIGVDFKSYRDQWLSEGFAEYSSLIYTQMILKDNKKFFELLEDYRKTLVNLRKSFLADGVKAAPISLGYRTRSEATRDDYQNIIYGKGAWVFHMLRNFVIDFKTMDEKLFLTILSDYFKTYRDSSASTKDFINIVNKHVGMDMTWFFNQWVESNDIPTYTFGYKSEKTPEGKFKITGRIKQTGVPAGFQMSVPVKIEFGEDKFTIMRVNVVKPYQEFEFPLMPLEPEEIELNVFQSVLCEVDTDDFEDIVPE